MQLNVVNAKYKPRVSRVLSMRVVDHVVVSVACVRKEGKLIFLILFEPRSLLSLHRCHKMLGPPMFTPPQGLEF